MLVSSMFLAAKAEECHIRVEQVVRIVSELTATSFAVEDVLRSEMQLLEGVHFCLRMYHPFLMLDAIRMRDVESTFSPEFWLHLNELVRDSLITDAQFLFDPVYIALAVILSQISSTKDKLTLKTFVLLSSLFTSPPSFKFCFLRFCK